MAASLDIYETSSYQPFPFRFVTNAKCESFAAILQESFKNQTPANAKIINIKSAHK